MDNLLIILWLCGFIIWIPFNIFITSLCFYGAMFAKRESLRFLCCVLIVISMGSIIDIGITIRTMGKNFKKILV